MLPDGVTNASSSERLRFPCVVVPPPHAACLGVNVSHEFFTAADSITRLVSVPHGAAFPSLSIPYRLADPPAQ